MKIWVDADACPQIIKNILYRAAIRTQTPLILVSNQWLQIPPSPYIKKIKVASGFDVADKEIFNQMSCEDLVITADVVLADAVVLKGGIAINPRGTIYTQDNINERLVFRNLSEQLRDSGIMTRGPSKLSQKEVQAFANGLDKLLSTRKK
jgi:uncharacterized protein YaiI (UPF0178 family)